MIHQEQKLIRVLLPLKAYLFAVVNMSCFRENLYQGLKLYNFFLYRSSFSDFAQKHGKDERFRNIEKMRERESLFNEYLLDVRKREKEEKVLRREQVRLLWTYLPPPSYCQDRLANVLTTEYY
jgi:hypothetical protein